MRSLHINTSFFQDDQIQINQHPRIQLIDQIYIRKKSAAFSLENKINTFILKILFSSWNQIKQYQSQDSLISNGERSAFTTSQRLRHNIHDLKKINKTLSNKNSSIKIKQKSLSPSQSTQITQSKAIILNEIVEKLKSSNKTLPFPHQQTVISKKLGKLEKMLYHIKQEHQRTQNPTIKDIKNKTIFTINYPPQQSENINIQNLCLQQIKKLKEQVNQIKRVQIKLQQQKNRFQWENSFQTKRKRQHKQTKSVLTQTTTYQLNHQNSRKLSNFVKNQLIQSSVRQVNPKKSQVIVNPTNFYTLINNGFQKSNKIGRISIFNPSKICQQFKPYTLKTQAYQPINVLSNSSVLINTGHQSSLKPISFRRKSNSNSCFKIIQYNQPNIKYVQKQISILYKNNQIPIFGYQNIENRNLVKNNLSKIFIS